MCYHLVDLSPFLSHPTSSNIFIVLYWVAGAVIVLGVGWQDYSPLPTCPLHPRLSIHSTLPLLHILTVSCQFPWWSVHPRAYREVGFCSSGWSAHSHAEEDGLVSSSRTGSDSAGSHAARRGAAYQWSFTCFHRVESGMFSPVWWLLIRFWDYCFPMP